METPMPVKILQFVAMLCTAVAMAAGWAHLLALPNKIGLPRDEYFIAQQVYRGWALLGIPIFAALGLILVLAILLRRRRAVFRWTAAAGVCIALAMAIFFVCTLPANQATANWSTMPANWQTLRAQWEYSHAAGAVLYVTALACLTLSLLVDP